MLRINTITSDSKTWMGGDISLRIREIKMAIAIFVTGPARAIFAESILGSLRLKGSKGAGLPQPNPLTRMASVPRGSRWARGFRVVLPSDLGVGSPSLSAIKQWAASCKPMAMTRPPKIRTNWAGFWRRSCKSIVLSIQGEMQSFASLSLIDYNVQTYGIFV